jgi:hypothetical protein
MRKLIIAAVLAAAAMGAQPALAADVDHAGPWADFVVEFNQAQRVDGSDVLPARSDPTDALGVAERTDVEGTFVSLGFGGTITVGFENRICNLPGADFALEVVETTREPYPPELVRVEVSQDGVTYIDLGVYNKDAFVPLPAGVTYVQYVRLTDVSNPALFVGLPGPPADGYDVDGVRALHTGCVDTGRFTGGGSVFTAAGERVTHGTTLRCEIGAGPDRLEVNWGKGNKFHLEQITSKLCSDTTLDEENPKAGFDTIDGTGTGRYNGKSGATVSFTFTDSGEPGVADTARIVIKDAGGNTVLAVSGPLKNGNHQAHP